jgi:hypothetical protein
LVSSSCNRDQLARKRTVVAVLRLVVEGPGDFIHGEIVTPSGQVVARFRTWSGLVPALQGWLAQEGTEEDPGEAARADRTPKTEDGP